MSEKSIVVSLKGTLRDAIVTIGAELESRDDIFDQMTEAEVARRLMIYAIQKHRNGEGPWAT
jgi:hypothetical protein